MEQLHSSGCLLYQEQSYSKQQRTHSPIWLVNRFLRSSTCIDEVFEGYIPYMKSKKKANILLWMALLSAIFQVCSYLQSFKEQLRHLLPYLYFLHIELYWSYWSDLHTCRYVSIKCHSDFWQIHFNQQLWANKPMTPFQRNVKCVTFNADISYYIISMSFWWLSTCHIWG